MSRCIVALLAAWSSNCCAADNMQPPARPPKVEWSQLEHETPSRWDKLIADVETQTRRPATAEQRDFVAKIVTPWLSRVVAADLVEKQPDHMSIDLISHKDLGDLFVLTYEKAHVRVRAIDTPTLMVIEFSSSDLAIPGQSGCANALNTLTGRFMAGRENAIQPEKLFCWRTPGSLYLSPIYQVLQQPTSQKRRTSDAMVVRRHFQAYAWGSSCGRPKGLGRARQRFVVRSAMQADRLRG